MNVARGCSCEWKLQLTMQLTDCMLVVQLCTAVRLSFTLQPHVSAYPTYEPITGCTSSDPISKNIQSFRELHRFVSATIKDQESL